MKMKNLFFAFFLVVSLASPLMLVAAVPDESLAEGIRYHDQARLDPEPNIGKGEKILGGLQDSSPVAKAYYGSIITIEASVYAKKKNGIKALVLLSRGTGLIDAAIKLAPDNADIRFLRMINSYEVSEGSPLNRYKEMKMDIDWLVERREQFDSKKQGVLDLYRGLYLAKAHKIDEATSAFDACIAISPGSVEAAEADKQLSRYAE